MNTLEVLRASAVQTVGTETMATPHKFQEQPHGVVFVLDITAAATDADDTLDVYLDTSYDGGTTWINFAHFTQALGNGGAKKFLVSMHEDVSSHVAVSTDLTGTGAVRSIQLGDRVRYRGTVVDPTGSNGSFTWSLKMFATPHN